MGVIAKTLLWLHGGCLLLGCLSVGVLYFFFPRMLHYDPHQQAVRVLALGFTVISLVAGLASMALRRRESESVVLGTSTVCAVVLMFLLC